MAEAQLVLGGVVDIATGKEVREAVDSGVDRLIRRRDKDRKIRTRIPKSYTVIGAASATGTWVLDFGMPPAGWVWEMVEVVITAGDDRTAPASMVAALYNGNPPGQNQNNTISATPALANLMRPAQAVPATFVFGGEDYTIHYGENLFAVVYSPTTAITVMSGVATVLQVDSSAICLDRM